MVIENRNLAEGTVLSVTYKKAEHRCTVIKTDRGLSFQLTNGTTFNSPSSAGKAITGRVSCDGWKFWSVAEGATAIAPTEHSPRPGEPEAEKPARGPKLIRNVKKMPNQKGLEEGWTKFWCSACMKAFVAETTLVPEECPEGHAREMADEFAVAAEAAEAE